jgi:hypothetical protein
VGKIKSGKGHIFCGLFYHAASILLKIKGKAIPVTGREGP